jgi:hypothetical protein
MAAACRRCASGDRCHRPPRAGAADSRADRPASVATTLVHRGHDALRKQSPRCKRMARPRRKPAQNRRQFRVAQQTSNRPGFAVGLVIHRTRGGILAQQGIVTQQGMQARRNRQSRFPQAESPVGAAAPSAACHAADVQPPAWRPVRAHRPPCRSQAVRRRRRAAIGAPAKSALAPRGAVSRPSQADTLSALPASQCSRKPPPPMPEDCGSTRFSTHCAAIAASSALPPSCRISDGGIRRMRIGRDGHEVGLPLPPDAA